MNHRADDLNGYPAAAKASVEKDAFAEDAIGNEAADLDFMVSAILYGRHVSARMVPDAQLVVPVVNCPRDDFVQRTEAVHLFASLDLQVDALVFINEIDLGAAHAAGPVLCWRAPRLTSSKAAPLSEES